MTFCEDNIENFGIIKFQEFDGHLSNYQLLKDPTP
jgi:hypothetical protein